MEHAVFSQNLGKVAAEGDSLVVSYDYVAGRRVPLRADHRAAIIALEGHEPPPLPPRTRRTRSSE
jgi:acyl-CoA thioester hydrolase